MTTARFICALIVLLFSLLLLFLNWAAVFENQRNKRRGIDKRHSLIPLVSAVSTGIALLLYPYTPKMWMLLIPALDIGNWTLIVGLPWAIINGMFSKAPPDDQNDHDIK
jgi:hypothetical protein